MISVVSEIKKIIPIEPNSNSLEEFLGRAEDYAQDSEFESDIGSAKEFYDLLSGLYVKQALLFKSSPALEERINKLMIKLAWFNPFILDTKQKNPLITSQLVRSIREGWMPMQTIQKWLEYYQPEGDAPDAGRVNEILSLLTINEERIGSAPIHLQSGEDVAPVVRNWIRDYISHSSVGNSRVDSYAMAQYLSDNDNVKKLSPAERTTLTEVVRIYNYLKEQRTLSTIAATEEGRPQPGSQVFSKPLSIPSQSLSAPTLNAGAKQPQGNIPRGASLDLLKSRLEKNAPVPTLTPNRVRMTSEEIDREVDTVELPEHRDQVQTPVVPKPPLVKKEAVAPKPQPLVAKMQTINFVPKAQVMSALLSPMNRSSEGKPAPVAAPQPKPVSSIRAIDDLKKLDVTYLRAGNLEEQIKNLKLQMSNLARDNNVLPYHVVLAYEQSPLFMAYLKAGTAKITKVASTGDPASPSATQGGPASPAASLGGLTQAEFEALADLRKEIEHI